MVEDNEEYQGYVTVKELADSLNVSSARISQLVLSLGLNDQLIKNGNKKLVSPDVVHAVEKRMAKNAQPPKEEKNLISKDKATIEQLKMAIENLNNQVTDLKEDKGNLQNTINGLTQANINNSKALESRDRRIEQLEQGYGASDITNSYSRTERRSESNDDVASLRRELDEMKSREAPKGFFARLFKG